MGAGRGRAATAAALMVVGFGAFTAWVAHGSAERRAVAAAAVAGYVAAHPGARVGEVSRQGERDGCALVEVTQAQGAALHLVVQRQGDWWVYLGRSTVDLDGSPLPEVCRPGSDLLGDR